MRYISGFFLCLVVIGISCKKSYKPPYIVAPGSYLVVEGVINSGPGQTTIMMSKTVNLSSSNAVNPVLNASVVIESDRGASYPVPEAGKGKYISASLTLDITAKYRLHIKTADNHEYLSDFVPVTNSPPVDNVSFDVKSNGIQIYASTHDPTNTTHFYRWEYEETWVLHSAYFSLYKSNGDTVLERDIDNDQIYQCWHSDTSGTIVLATSSGLSSDIINNAPIAFIESTSHKLDGKQSQVLSQKRPEVNAYSILVKQFALTREAYSYWINLKKNTQDIGKIFDPLPTEIRGNIHSVTDPLEPVLGYISAGSMTTKRGFVSNGQIPTEWTLDSPYDGCRLDSAFLDTLLRGQTIPTNQENALFNVNKSNEPSSIQIPVYALFKPLTRQVFGHTGSSPYCVDCTVQGTNKVPDFWQFIHE